MKPCAKVPRVYHRGPNRDQGAGARRKRNLHMVELNLFRICVLGAMHSPQQLGCTALQTAK